MKRLGRPSAESQKTDLAKQMFGQGKGVLNTARAYGLGTGTVHKLKREMAAA